jgi:hypothetical protein
VRRTEEEEEESEEEEEEPFLSPLVDFSSENLCLKLCILLVFHAPVLGSPSLRGHALLCCQNLKRSGWESVETRW